MKTYRMTEAHVDFLRRVRDGSPLKMATREEDRVRQQCRQIGWVEVLKCPRRWALTALGHTYMRNAIDAPNGAAACAADDPTGPGMNTNPKSPGLNP